MISGFERLIGSRQITRSRRPQQQSTLATSRNHAHIANEWAALQARGQAIAFLKSLDSFSRDLGGGARRPCESGLPGCSAAIGHSRDD